MLVPRQGQPYAAALHRSNSLANQSSTKQMWVPKLSKPIIDVNSRDFH